MNLSRLLPHYKATLRLGFPIAVGQLGVIVVGFADTAMVGHYATDALAAASFVNNLFNLVTFVLMGYSFGLTPLVSSLYGCGQHRQVGALLRSGLCSVSLFGGAVLLAMAVLYFFLGQLGQPPELLGLIRPYYLIILVSMVFVCVFNVLRQFTDGITDTAIGMWALLSGNVLNVLGNWLLIGGVGPFPEMGLLGAGTSTLLSRVLMVAVLGAFILRKKGYKLYRQGFAAGRASRRDVAYVHRQSYPVALQMGMETGAFTFSAVMAGWLGTVELASYQVLMTIGTLGFLFYYSFGSGTSIRVASFAGTGDWERVRAAGWAGCHILCALAACSSLAIFLFAEPLASVFSADPRVIALTVSLVGPLVLYQFGDAMQICFANSLRGTGHVLSMMWIAFVSYVCLCVPCGFLLAFPCGLGLYGLFLAFSVGLFTAAALFLKQYRRVLRRHLG